MPQPLTIVERWRELSEERKTESSVYEFCRGVGRSSRGRSVSMATSPSQLVVRTLPPGEERLIHLSATRPRVCRPTERDRQTDRAPKLL